MNCPRTGARMKEVRIGDVKVDLSEGCGGVWFDNFELQKFDEVTESAGEELMTLTAPHARDDLDLEERLHCPRHPEIVMQRRFFSPKRKIEVDECPECGGIWLDAGELGRIHELFPTEEDQERAGREFVEEMMRHPELQRMRQESRERLQKARRVANMFKWICPSAYIPGKQDWGAF